MVKKVEGVNPLMRDIDSMISLSIYDEDVTERDSMSNNSPGMPKPTSPKSPTSNLSEESDSDLPVLFGSFTNWKGVRMMTVDDFVMVLAKKYGRQNAEMLEDFDHIITIMRKKLSGMRRSPSRFMSTTVLGGITFTV